MSQLQYLQARVVQTLAEHAFFRPSGGVQIPVLHEDLGDLITLQNNALKSAGACVTIGIGRCQIPEPNIPGPRFGVVDILLLISENPVANRLQGGSRQPGIVIAQAALGILHHIAEIVPGAGCINAGEIDPVRIDNGAANLIASLSVQLSNTTEVDRLDPILDETGLPITDENSIPLYADAA